MTNNLNFSIDLTPKSMLIDDIFLVIHMIKREIGARNVDVGDNTIHELMITYEEKRETNNILTSMQNYLLMDHVDYSIFLFTTLEPIYQKKFKENFIMVNAYPSKKNSMSNNDFKNKILKSLKT